MLIVDPAGSIESRPDRCSDCRGDLGSAGRSWFVAFGSNRTHGRRVCFGCLMTLFQLDTLAEIDSRRRAEVNPGGSPRGARATRTVIAGDARRKNKLVA